MSGQTVQWVGACSAPVEDHGLVPSTHLVAYNPRSSSSWDTWMHTVQIHTNWQSR